MTKKVGIPWELKYNFAMEMYANCRKEFFYVIRDEFDADTALRLYEKICIKDDKIKYFTKKFLTLFKIEGYDAETIAQFLDAWWELTGAETTWIERSKTIARVMVTKCPFKTKYKDLSDWDLNIFISIVAKTINPNFSVEQCKNMCAGDSYCEFVFKIEE